MPVTGALPDLGPFPEFRQSARNRHSTGTRVRNGAVRQPDRARFHGFVYSQVCPAWAGLGRPGQGPVVCRVPARYRKSEKYSDLNEGYISRACPLHNLGGKDLAARHYVL